MCVKKIFSNIDHVFKTWACPVGLLWWSRYVCYTLIHTRRHIFRIQIHHVFLPGWSNKGMKFSHSWLMSVKKKWVVCISEDGLTYSIVSWQDFEAARKKALAIGAKKFFLEVCFPSFFYVHTKCLRLLCCLGPEAWIHNWSHLSRSPSKLHLRGLSFPLVITRGIEAWIAL